ncbi:MAG: hypothetical protein KGJ40_04295 [candidate division NC10 bacterium]|nr:hypothetical protein [candidate division NC10 bacterium]MDE2485716.1 hypothetical protein [candidate division NC10 bacterium]
MRHVQPQETSIKAGSACHTDRIAKYNQLLGIGLRHGGVRVREKAQCAICGELSA